MRGNGVGKSNSRRGVSFLKTGGIGRSSKTTQAQAEVLIVSCIWSEANRPLSPSELEFVEGDNANGYSFEARRRRGPLYLFKENYWYHNRSKFPDPITIIWELAMPKPSAEGTEPIAGHVRHDLDSYRIYHFHDTSSSAR